MNPIQPFHLAIPVNNVAQCQIFYREIIGCQEGRSSDHWVDFNFYGHQLVIHYKKGKQEEAPTNSVDGKEVPIPHFGVVIAPYIRFKGELGEQATMFFKDPSGNALEFKAFKNIDQLFAS
jgi:extradiol dioxygenase family protein